MLTLDNAKNIIEKMANGTANPEEEEALEAYALQEWGYTAQDGQKKITLGDSSPRSASQLLWKSVRESIEFHENIAANWYDIIHEHPLLGYADNGEYYGNEVYSFDYIESVERNPEGNFITIDFWMDDHYENLIKFRCVEGNIGDTKSFSHKSEPMYIFDEAFNRMPVCDECANIQGIVVVCKKCLEELIEKGICWKYKD
jgi:hypothetical protein